MKDFFHVVTTTILIALGAVTVYLMLKDRKKECSCNEGARKAGGLEPPSCGIGIRGSGGKKHIGLVK